MSPKVSIWRFFLFGGIGQTLFKQRNWYVNVPCKNRIIIFLTEHSSFFWKSRESLFQLKLVWHCGSFHFHFCAKFGKERFLVFDCGDFFHTRSDSVMAPLLVQVLLSFISCRCFLCPALFIACLYVCNVLGTGSHSSLFSLPTPQYICFKSMQW